MKKIKSYSFWVALSGAAVVFVSVLGKIFGFAIKDELVSDLVMAFAGILVVFGVVSMPAKEDENKEENDMVENQDDDKKEE